MKKFVLFSVLIALTACGSTTSTYYKGDLKVVQDGENCVSVLDHYGDFADKKFDSKGRVIYKNIKCADVMHKRNIEERSAEVVKAAPAPKPVIAPVAKPKPVQPIIIVINNKVNAEAAAVAAAKSESKFEIALNEMQAREKADADKRAADVTARRAEIEQRRIDAANRIAEVRAKQQQAPAQRPERPACVPIVY